MPEGNMVNEPNMATEQSRVDQNNNFWKRVSIGLGIAIVSWVGLIAIASMMR